MVSDGMAMSVNVRLRCYEVRFVACSDGAALYSGLLSGIGLVRSCSVAFSTVS